MEEIQIFALSWAHSRRIWQGFVPFILVSIFGLWVFYRGITGRVSGEGSYHTTYRIMCCSAGILLQAPVVAYYLLVRNMISR